MRDPYTILGISKNATFEEIKSAYFKLVKKYHPDVTDLDDTHEIMVEINAAYEFLKNNHQRQQSNSQNSYTKTKKQNDNSTRKEETKKTNNNQKTKTNTNNQKKEKTYTKEEWEDFCKEYWQKAEANKSAYYAQTGIKIKSRVAKILEPIRRDNNDFNEQIKKCNNYNELLKICEEHYKKVDEMIQFMYNYAEKCHKYGLPSYYKYGHKNYNTNVKVYKNFPLREVIKSNLIKAYGYDDKNNVLYVKFLNDTIYVYYCVSPKLYQDFESTEHKGKFFSDYVRNEYDYRRID